MELPKRKNIRLPKYNYGENGVYFITICAKDRRPILSEIVGDDAHIVPTPCGTVVEKHIRNDLRIERYVIMPDHIHLIVRIENGAMRASPPTNQIAGIVRSLKTLITKELGESIFQRSYYDHVIRNEQDYKETILYMENNPLKWKLTHGNGSHNSKPAP